VSDTQVITISRNGEARFLYDDRLRGLLTHGPASVARAGHVEPGDPRRKQDPASWYSDLKPVGGPVFGPFDRRSQALEAEVEWIQAHVLDRTA
jgi:hypothetical protein